MSIKKSVAAVAAASVFFASPAFAAGYLMLGDIKGESRDASHKDWIDIRAVTDGGVTNLSTASTGRTRAGVNWANFEIVKDLDASSPLLRDALARGRVFQDAEIHFTRSGERAPYYKIKMSNVRVTSVGGTVSDEGREETLSLMAEGITWTYDPQTPGGKTTTASTGVQAGGRR